MNVTTRLSVSILIKSTNGGRDVFDHKVSSICNSDCMGKSIFLQQAQTKRIAASFVGNVIEFEKKFFIGENKIELTPQFHEIYTESIRKKLEGRCPYSASKLEEEKIDNNGWKRKASALLSAALMVHQPLIKAVSESQYLPESHYFTNLLGLSYVVPFITRNSEKLWLVVMDYLKGCFGEYTVPDYKQLLILRTYLDFICNTVQEVKVQELLEWVMKLEYYYRCLNEPCSELLLEFLLNITLDQAYSYLLGAEAFTEWLSTVPEVLTYSRISLSTIVLISKLCALNIPGLYLGLYLSKRIIKILENVANINIEKCSEKEAEEGRIEIIRLLCWVSHWDEDMVKDLGKIVSSLGMMAPDLLSHLIQTLSLKIEVDPKNVLKTLLENESWWKSATESRTAYS